MTFVKNVDAIVNAIGAQHPGIVLNLAAVDWQSEDDRDAFLGLLTRSKA